MTHPRDQSFSPWPSDGGPSQPEPLARSDRAVEGFTTGLSTAKGQGRPMTWEEEVEEEEDMTEEKKIARETREGLPSQLPSIRLPPSTIRSARAVIVWSLAEGLELDEGTKAFMTATPSKACTNVGCEAFHIPEDCSLEPMCDRCGAYKAHYSHECGATCTRYRLPGHSDVYCKQVKNPKTGHVFPRRPTMTVRRPVDDPPRQVGDLWERISREVAKYRSTKAARLASLVPRPGTIHMMDPVPGQGTTEIRGQKEPTAQNTRKENYAAVVKKPLPVAPPGDIAPNWKCSMCKKEGHKTSECPVPFCTTCIKLGHQTGDKTCRFQSIECYHCHRMGHTKAECELFVCKICGQHGHLKINCRRCEWCQKEDCKPGECPEMICLRCGKIGHMETKCPEEIKRQTVNYMKRVAARNNMTIGQVEQQTSAWRSFQATDEAARRQTALDAERDKVIAPPADSRTLLGVQAHKRMQDGRKVVSYERYDLATGETRSCDKEGNFTDSEVIESALDWVDQAEDQPSMPRGGSSYRHRGRLGEGGRRPGR